MRKLLLVMFSVVAMFVLAACGNKVDEDISEKYITKAEEIVSLLNDANYEEVHAMLDDEAKEGLSEAAMEELTPFFKQSGDFEKINKSSAEEKDGNYTVVLAANYSEENRIFTISFNEQDEVTVLWIN